LEKIKENIPSFLSVSFVARCLRHHLEGIESSVPRVVPPLITIGAEEGTMLKRNGLALYVCDVPGCLKTFETLTDKYKHMAEKHP
jgi:hypothetical protein